MIRKDLAKVSLRNALMSQCSLDESDVIDRHLAAVLLGVSVRTLERWQNTGFGPAREPWWGRQVGYSKTELENWRKTHSPQSKPRKKKNSDQPGSAKSGKVSTLCNQLQPNGQIQG